MKTVILAGGHGRRFQFGHSSIPKPLVTIGDRPLLRHVMDVFQAQGFDDFLVALGAASSEISDFFGRPQPIAAGSFELVDTGQETGSGGRLARLKAHLTGEDRFFLTYCDGLSDVDLNALLDFHIAHGKAVTMTAVHPPGRFGLVGWKGDNIVDFREKPPNLKEWINGGFFVVERRTLDLIQTDDASWERDILPALAARGELMGFRHEGFFAAVDTPKDRDAMEEIWRQGAAPWYERERSCPSC